MLNKGLSIIVILLFIGLCVVPTTGTITNQISKLILSGDTFYVGGSGPNNYSTIQSAIDDAVDGDTVFVYDDSSPYYENVVIGKPISLIGEDKHRTIITGDGYGAVIMVTSDSVTITGFTVTMGAEGITLNNANHCIISNNIVSNCGTSGIHLEYLDNNNLIIGNNVKNNYYGIRLDTSDGNTITNNDISYNSNGIRIDHSSDNNHIIDNTINKIQDGGIKIRESNGNHITGNNISDSYEFIFFYNDCNNNIVSNNSLTKLDSIKSQSFIEINHNSNNNIFYMNTIENYGDSNITDGFHVFNSDKNNFSRNTIINLYVAFLVVSSYNNTFFMNNIINCTIGFSINEGNDSKLLKIIQKNNPNIVINNNIIGVSIKGFSKFTLSLETIWEGNYWGRPRILPKIIIGFKMITEDFGIPSRLEFDWNPAQEPYEIEV